jgi:hypothetical protein
VQPAALRYALLGLAAGFPPAAAAAALCATPGLDAALGARDPSLRAAAASALRAHLGRAPPPLDGALLRRLVTAAGDASPDASEAAFSALGALFGGVAGERPGAHAAAAPHPAACRAAACAAEDCWSARRELLTRAAKLPPAMRVAALYPLVRRVFRFLRFRFAFSTLSRCIRICFAASRTLCVPRAAARWARCAPRAGWRRGRRPRAPTPTRRWRHSQSTCKQRCASHTRRSWPRLPRSCCASQPCRYENEEERELARVMCIALRSLMQSCPHLRFRCFSFFRRVRPAR